MDSVDRGRRERASKHRCNAQEFHGSPLYMLHESQRRFVHAVTLKCRLRAIVKQVAQMRVATRAADFCALHEHAPVGARANVLLRNWRPKTRPAGSRIVLRVGTEKR